MKLLKIENKKCFYSIDGLNYKPISEIEKEDVFGILNIIYENDDYELDQYTDEVEISNDVERLIYSNLYSQLNSFIANKSSLIDEVNNMLEDVRKKYLVDFKE